MCWTGKKIRKVALNDIPVYKIGFYENEKSSTSYFQRFIYEAGKKYSSEVVLKCTYDDNVLIKEGLHSYSFKTELERTTDFLIVRNKLRYVEGYPINEYKLCLAKIYCTIPRGAFYYENELGEIVSNELIIDNIIKIE